MLEYVCVAERPLRLGSTGTCSADAPREHYNKWTQAQIGFSLALPQQYLQGEAPVLEPVLRALAVVTAPVEVELGGLISARQAPSLHH